MHYIEQEKVYELTNDELQALIDSVFDVELEDETIIPDEDEIDECIEKNIDDPYVFLYILWIVYAGPYIPTERKKDYDKLKKLAERTIRVIE